MYLSPIPFSIALLLAVMTPVLVIAVRHSIRLTRIRAIDAFNRVFENDDVDEKGKHGPSFEFVRAKYSSDLDECPEGVSRHKLRDLDLSDDKVDAYLSGLKWWQLRSNRALLWVSMPYMLLCFYGFLVAFYPYVAAPGYVRLDELIAPVPYMAARDAAGPLDHTIAIAAFCFVGAYLFSVRLFLRAVNVFDFSAITILRAMLHIAMSVLGGVALFRALPDLAQPVAFAVQKLESLAGVAPSAGPQPLAGGWYIAAFVFGFVPDSLIQFIFGKLEWLRLNIKTTDDRFSSHTRSIPLDVIDGIDFFTRFRLEEANVSEVQNLACANPIMLFVETPYPFYQTVDWVAQAQLCAIAGPERFVLFRQHNIRTIFDLERAVLSKHSTPQVRRIVAGILLMSTQTARAVALSGGAEDAKYFASVAADGAEMLSLAEYQKLASRLAGTPSGGSDPDATVKHLVRVMVDDLHVHRLRQIWEKVARRLGADAEALDDTEQAPGDRSQPLRAARKWHWRKRWHPMQTAWRTGR